MALMTNGQHDSAWLDVMTNQIPSARKELDQIERDLRKRNGLEAANILVKLGWMEEATLAQICTDAVSDVWDIKKINELDDKNKKERERFDGR